MRSCILYIFSFFLFSPSFSFAELCSSYPPCSDPPVIGSVCNIDGRTVIVNSFLNRTCSITPPPYTTISTYAVPSTATFTCYNNYFKVGIYLITDYPCDSTPPFCSDGLISGDEEGYDCGGSCSAPCESFCYGDDTFDGYLSNTCYSSAPPDAYGNCPPGYTDGKVGDLCLHAYSAPQAKDGFDFPDNPSPPQGFTTPSTSSSSSTSSSWTPDPVGASGAGTLSTTTSSTTTNSDGSSTTNNLTTNNYYAGDGEGGRGELTGSDSSSSSSSDDPTEDPSNYNYSYNGEGQGFNADIDLSLLPPAKTFDGLTSFITSNNPVSNMTKDMTLSASGTCSFSLPTPYGSFDLDFCQYTWVINLMGAALVFCSYLFALFIIFA